MPSCHRRLISHQSFSALNDALRVIGALECSGPFHEVPMNWVGGRLGDALFPPWVQFELSAEAWGRNRLLPRSQTPLGLFAKTSSVR